MRREPVHVDSMAQQGEGDVRTAVVGPTGAALDEAGVARDAPVMVMLHGFDSRWVRQYQHEAIQAVHHMLAHGCRSWQCAAGLSGNAAVGPALSISWG